MEKFTKGEWKFLEGHDNFGNIYEQTDVLGTIKGGEDCDIHICRIWSDVTDDPDMVEEKANAHLIEQAPRMYSALKELCDSCMGECADCKVSGILRAARGES